MNSYWQQRKFQEETALANMSEVRLNKKLAKEYQRMQRDIIRDMENVYYKIMQEGGSDVALASHLYQYQGYYQTLAQVQQKLIDMGSHEIEQIDSSLQQLYIANGKRITKQFNIRLIKPIICSGYIILLIIGISFQILFLKLSIFSNESLTETNFSTISLNSCL